MDFLKKGALTSKSWIANTFNKLSMMKESFKVNCDGGSSWEIKTDKPLRKITQPNSIPHLTENEEELTRTDYIRIDIDELETRLNFLNANKNVFEAIRYRKESWWKDRRCRLIGIGFIVGIITGILVCVASYFFTMWVMNHRRNYSR